MSVDTKRRFLLFLDPDPHLASLFIFGKCAMMCVCVCVGTRVCVQVSTISESPPIMENLRCDWAPMSNRFYLV